MTTLKITNNKTNILVIGLPYLLLILVCLFNLTWNITDHDDGHTLGFHNMGRNSDIQRSYGVYDSMCDFLLGILPINYEILYSVMVGSTVIASLAILFFAGRLLQMWFSFNSIEIAIGQLLFTLAMPEFMYLAFSFKSVYVSLAFILLSANVLFKNTNSYINVLMGAILFGFGVSLRWNSLIVGAPIATMLIWELVSFKNWSKAISTTMIWGITALVSSILFIYTSGYSPEGIIKSYLWGKQYIGKADFQFIARIGDLSLFITPASSVLFIVGSVFLIKNKVDTQKYVTLVLVTLLSLATVSLIPGFKIWAPLWISFIALFAYAYRYISNLTLFYKRLIISVIYFSLFVNWFVGIQISTPSSNWGPGLNVKTNVESLDVFDKNLRTDERFNLENIRVGFFDGFCLPTAEGMRPLYGHFYALFLGKLNQLNNKLNRETDKVLQEAKIHQQIIYQDRINPYLLATYTRYGFTTSDSWKQNAKEFHKRTFTNGKDTITEIRINDPKHLFDINKLKQNINPTDTIYAAFTYTSALNKFLYKWQKENNGHFEKMGPLSAKIWQ